MNRHFRDSWNAWREKVNAALGTVEQIDASEVLFNNDDTDLTANDVQDAIEELNGVTSKLDNCYVTGVIRAQFSSNGDGTKTFGECLSDIASQLVAACAALGDDEAIVPHTLFVASVAWMGIIGKDVYDKTTSSVGCVFVRSEINASAENTWFAKIHATTPVLKGCSIGTTPTISISSFESNVPADGTTIVLYYDKIKKIS